VTKPFLSINCLFGSSPTLEAILDLLLGMVGMGFILRLPFLRLDLADSSLIFFLNLVRFCRSGTRSLS
jgi:hypothetical protein